MRILFFFYQEKLSDCISELQGRSENIEDLVSELELAYNSVEVKQADFVLFTFNTYHYISIYTPYVISCVNVCEYNISLFSVPLLSTRISVWRPRR